MTTDRSPEDVLGQLTADLGGSLGTVLTGLGIRCGLWEALAGAGPLSAAEVGGRAGIVEPYAREWLRAQAAGGYLDYDPATDRFTLPEPVAVALLQAPGGALWTRACRCSPRWAPGSPSSSGRSGPARGTAGTVATRPTGRARTG